MHATVTRDGGDEIVGDIAVHDESGTPLGGITGFRVADVEKASTAVGLATIDGWLVEPSWSELPAGSDAPDQLAEHPDHWLLFADSRGVADELAARITGRGGSCHLVRPGNGYRTSADGRESTVEPGSAADLGRLLADRRAAGAPDPAAVVHLWNLDRPALAGADHATVAGHTGTGAYSLITLAALVSAELPDSRLHIVTRAAQATAPGEPVEPLGAPAWGIGRVLRHQELPGHPGKLIDLGPADAVTEEAAALLREFALADEDEIALRAGRRLTNRLRPRRA